MLPYLGTHKQYLRGVRRRASRYGGLRASHRHYAVWEQLRQTNLDASVPLLRALYTSQQGRPARSPVQMFHAWLAMSLCGITSVTE